MAQVTLSCRDARPAAGAAPALPPAILDPTPSAYDCQRLMRVEMYSRGVQTAAMRDVSAVARRLKQIRSRSGLSIRQVAEALGMEHGSSYQHYEDRFKKPLLPLDLILRLVPIFGPRGVDSAELFALAGVDGSGQRPLASFTRPETAAPMMRIEE